ncbi:OmpA family protein [Flavobacterium orientale]|uniref:Cell envelope biogenesis protein OmpA n=1 Tax=Flavobacterium orientale TaxID=1756020 RepID=A0A916Y0P1_9FLAO|nr:OmpA family protein [Flavobacterium orientale]GGD25601.1 cell envelope biogenesis protein OmpA [Flavobacterium orientale]
MFRFLQFSIFFLAFLLNAQEQESFYFDSNKFELKKSELARLNDWINENTKVKIVAINGYADEDGSVGFNDTLAQKRVNFVFNEIGNKVAIRSDFKTRSYGKQHQQSEDKSKNRRVTVYFIEEKDLHREDEILGIKPIEKTPIQKPKRIFPEIIQIKNPNGSVSEYELNREFMQKIDESKPGEKLKIDNLNFHLNTFAIVNESRGKLYELLLVMQQNPNLEINIQGHLCCMPTDRNNLSTQRAKAIQQFLIFNGIEKSRLSYQGFGSSQPIFTLPEKNEEERAANRRVEIEIIKN